MAEKDWKGSVVNGSSTAVKGISDKFTKASTIVGGWLWTKKLQDENGKEAIDSPVDI